MATQMGTRLRTARLSVAAVATALLLAWLPGSCPLGADDAESDHRAEETAKEDADETNPLGANAACYICHIPFVREELGKIHLEAKVPCIECHGLSAAHANDEDIGATPPDVVFKRNQIDASCRKCHKTHDAPAQQVVARFIERRLSPKPAVVCTDCHGTHKIQRAVAEPR